MKIITHTNRFKKEFKLMMKRGANEQKFLRIVELLVFDKAISEKYRDHKLTVDYQGSRELHIEPDWLLIYRSLDKEVILELTGTSRRFI